MGGEAVDLRLVEEQEEGPVAPAAVVGVAPVEPRVGHPGLVELGQPLVGPLAQLVERTELDRCGRTRLGTGRDHAAALPVVAEGTLVSVAILWAAS